MKFHWPSFFSLIRNGHRVSQIFIVFIIVFVVAQYAVLFFGLPRNQSSIFLHYTVYFGVDDTGSILEALWIPGVASIVACINCFFAYILRNLRMRATVLALTCAYEVLVLIVCVLLAIINRSL